MFNECLGIMGWLFGHHFMPRITTTEEANPIFVGAKVEGGNYTSAQLRDLMVIERTTYHGDCCTRCGAVTNNPSIP